MTVYACIELVSNMAEIRKYTSSENTRVSKVVCDVMVVAS
jgi:hypothetical protein